MKFFILFFIITYFKLYITKEDFIIYENREIYESYIKLPNVETKNHFFQINTIEEHFRLNLKIIYEYYSSTNNMHYVYNKKMSNLWNRHKFDDFELLLKNRNSNYYKKMLLLWGWKPANRHNNNAQFHNLPMIEQ